MDLLYELSWIDKKYFGSSYDDIIIGYGFLPKHWICCVNFLHGCEVQQGIDILGIQSLNEGKLKFIVMNTV